MADAVRTTMKPPQGFPHGLGPRMSMCTQALRGRLRLIQLMQHPDLAWASAHPERGAASSNSTLPCLSAPRRNGAGLHRRRKHSRPPQRLQLPCISYPSRSSPRVSPPPTSTPPCSRPSESTTQESSQASARPCRPRPSAPMLCSSSAWPSAAERRCGRRWSRGRRCPLIASTRGWARARRTWEASSSLSLPSREPARTRRPPRHGRCSAVCHV